LCDKKFAEAGQFASLAGKTKKQCKAECADSAPPFSVEMCLKDLKVSGGCTCLTDKVADCDCSGSALEEVNAIWGLACMALGALGLIGAVVFTGIPAILAGWRYNRIVNACCFSVCSGIFSMIFIGCGAGFLLIGTAVATQKDTIMGECTASVSESLDGGADAPADPDAAEMVDDVVNCGLTAFCDGALVVVEKLGTSATMIGAPYFLAGITMFAGCYVGCCCKESVPKPPNSVTDTGPPTGKEMAPIAVPVAVVPDQNFDAAVPVQATKPPPGGNALYPPP